MKDLIPNPPSREAVRAGMAAKGEKERFQVTPLVRAALKNALNDDEQYDDVLAHLRGGEVTGSRHGDSYVFVIKLVEWERVNGNVSLHNALQSGKIKLNDIVKRVTPLLRDMNFLIERGVCIGYKTPSES